MIGSRATRLATLAGALDVRQLPLPPSVVGFGGFSARSAQRRQRANAASSSAVAAVCWQTIELRELPVLLPHSAPGHGAHSPQRRQQQWRLLAHL